MSVSDKATESEEERLRLDEQARREMASQAEASLASEEVDPSMGGETAWKWKIRKRVWNYLEENNIARPPRPVHHRIPNFEDADHAAALLASLPEFKAAQVVKVNPDTPQKQVRYLALSGGKVLLCPQPRLRTGFFSRLDPQQLLQSKLGEACSMAGVAKFGEPLGLQDKIKVDLLVIGSVAVDSNTGARLGKGEGFAELEYGMLRWMGAIDDSTFVVTSIHESQLVDDIPNEKLKAHDVPVDIICVQGKTNSRIIRTGTKIPKPKGIYWELLSPEKLAQVKVLRELKATIEKETGQKLPTGPSQALPPTAVRKGPQNSRRPSRRGSEGPADARVFCWNVPSDASSEDLVAHFRATAGMEVVGCDKFGEDFAKLQLVTAEDAAVAVAKVNRTQVGGRTIGVKLDQAPAARRNQRNRGNAPLKQET